MIRLVFDETDPMQTEEIPPAPYFRFDHETIRRGPDNHPVARRRPDDLWEITDTDKLHFRGSCEGRAQICFEDDGGNASRCFGPYDHVRVADGTINGDDRVIALFLDDSRRWMSLTDRTDWPAVVVKAA